jgi:hypothetical protein
MKQILHILEKDVRRFWREILIPLALLAVFTWTGPKEWRDASLRASYIGGFFVPGTVETFLPTLISISWWLLIVRVVHEERLVGDRQFWITRPYEWKKLIAAKALFVACFVYLPLAAAQWLLLAEAGLHPATHIGSLLYDWLLITVILILPIAAIAAVTRNFARMTLTLLGVLVTVLIVTSIFSALLQKGIVYSPVGQTDILDVPLLMLFCSAVILLAYARRSIGLGRILLLVLPVVLFLSQEFFASDAMVNHAYPKSDAGVQFTLRDNPTLLETAHPALNRKELLIQIPLHVAGITPGDLWVSNGARVTVESGGRAVWTSNWRPVNTQYLTADKDTALTFNVSREVFYSVQSHTVTLHVDLALDQARRTQVETVQASLRDIAVNGLGVCSSIIDPGSPYTVGGKTSLRIVGINCRSALRGPELTYVETVWTDGPCELNKTVINEFLPQPLLRSTWIGKLTDDPSELILAPIDVTPLNFLEYNRDQNSPAGRQICPGFPITFTRYGLVRQLRTAFTIDNFRFPSYDKGEDAAR